MKLLELISIIVPIYNVEKHLSKCVDSILNQTYKNLEIILVDDGSPDDCGAICDEYAKMDERVRVIHKKNGGLSDARNAGIEVARGEYIGFVDSDDYINRRMYESMYNQVKKDGSDMAICNLLSVDENGDLIGENNADMPVIDGVFTKEQIFAQLCIPKYWYYVTAWNKLYKKELLSEIRFPVGKLHEDEFVAHHIIGKCKKISCISKPFYFYVCRSGSIMNSNYNIKRLDSAEAYLDRARYMKDYGMDCVAADSLMRTILGLKVGYLRIWKDNREAQERIRAMSRETAKLCSYKTISKLHGREQAHVLVFKINPFTYYKITSLLRHLRKKEYGG